MGMSQPNRQTFPRPDGALFRGRIVTDGEHEIHPRGLRSRELIPALAAEAIGRDALVPEQFERERMDVALRMAAGAEGAEPSAREGQMIHHRFGHNPPRRVTGAQKENVEHLVLESNPAVSRRGVAGRSGAGIVTRPAEAAWPAGDGAAHPGSSGITPSLHVSRS
jgi:hypothetical protein